jgi:acyl-coenzyme A thioesterase PaaI-like protein
MSSGLCAATAVAPDGPGRFAVTVAPEWSIGGRPHGGYLMALALRAAVAASPHPDGLALSTHFLRPPAFGPAVIEVDELRVGRSVATHRARLIEQDAPVLEMTVTSGTLPTEPPTWSTPAITLPPRDQCVPARRKTPTGVDVAIMDYTEVLLDPATLGWALGADGPQPPEVRAWVRLRDEPSDPYAVVFAADVLPPTVFALGLLGWAPTVEMTIHLRARPAPGWLQVAASTSLVRGRWFEEDVSVWDEDGAIVGQGRQLALVGRPER